MNKAFVRETEDDRASNPLPDRPIPAGPNRVTPEGLAHIDQMLTLTEEQHAEAVATNDPNEIARAERDRRYWAAQRATAKVIGPSGSGETVGFGATVTIRRDDGRELTYRIVGVDEADPAQGTVSHISPLARALLGKSKGDEIAIGGKNVEITEVK
jgi:transcription elongation GreA/GreB family factor